MSDGLRSRRLLGALAGAIAGFVAPWPASPAAASVRLSVRLSVPFVPQEKDTCGAASLAMVLRYWGLPGDHEALVAAAAEPGQRGIAGSKLLETARRHGAFAVAYEGDLAQLKASLENGRPVIVALGARGGLQHDVVVVGFEHGRVLVHDPAEGRDREVREGEFDRRWHAASRWSLLVLPRQ